MDEFSIFIIVIALGFHVGLSVLIIVYICHKERPCSCSCPSKRENARNEQSTEEETEENTSESAVMTERSPNVQNPDTPGNQHVNVYFTHRWVSSLANRIQSYVSNQNSRHPDSTPTIVITGGTDSYDDEDLPCYNDALALEIQTMTSTVISLDSPPSYEDIFSATRL